MGDSSALLGTGDRAGATAGVAGGARCTRDAAHRSGNKSVWVGAGRRPISGTPGGGYIYLFIIYSFFSGVDHRSPMLLVVTRCHALLLVSSSHGS